MKKILILLTLVVNFSFAATLNLESGWNLLGINAPLTLDELKTQIGVENLLVIQGEEKTYQKRYVDANTNFLNDFEAFETGKGYWIEVVSNTTLTYGEPTNNRSSFELSLNEGWNLINAPVELTLAELIAQIGVENLLVVQGADETYQKRYIDANQGFLNDFTALSLSGGYWIKVASAVSLNFIFNVDKLAIDNKGQAVVSSMEFNNSTYSVKIYTNVEPSEVISPSTIAIAGTINGINTGSTFKLNSNYALQSNFMVKVFNAQNEEVARSSHIKYVTSPIDFGTVVFNVPMKDENAQINDAHFQGVNVFANKMSYAEYGLEIISDVEFNALSIENKRLLASKLFSVLFYGLPRTELDTLINSETFISDIQTKLAISNTDLTSTENFIKDKDYNWSQRNANRET